MKVRLALALALAGLLSGCKQTKLASGGCATDADCGSPASAFLCEPQTGACFCRTDAACLASQFCNPSGFCQDLAGCSVNADCGDTSLFCDTTTGQCLPLGRCANDLECGLGQVCDGTRQRCVTGCHDDGDCPGISCRCGDSACSCPGTSPSERAACAVGVCDSQFCSNDTFCKFGELCGVPPDAGVTRNQCYSDYDVDRRPYCDTCTNGGGTDTCGSGANYCIIDTRTHATYCGADCSDGQSCPRGYECRDIRIVYTRWQCSATNPCPGDPTLACTKDADCARGGSCLIATGQTSGFCAGQCKLKEGANYGYCSCQVDFDCPQQTCSQGECSVSRKKCVNDEDCLQIRCVDFGGIGACLIGQNCTPANGLTCVEVK